jgi:hypothetical protein
MPHRYKLTPTPGREDQPEIRRYRLTRMEEVSDMDEGRDRGTVKRDERRALRHLQAPAPGQEHPRQHL